MKKYLPYSYHEQDICIYGYMFIMYMCTTSTLSPTTCCSSVLYFHPPSQYHIASPPSHACICTLHPNQRASSSTLSGCNILQQPRQKLEHATWQRPVLAANNRTLPKHPWQPVLFQGAMAASPVPGRWPASCCCIWSHADERGGVAMARGRGIEF